MIRSLFGGVSGLRNHQTLMDVIGNNIANVNTIGFKSGRVTFKESLAQTLKGAQGPTENTGGKNPLQVGLGMAIGSIDSMFTQGNLENTGQVTDMAIQGDAFFVVSNGERDMYTRAGNFQLDSQGRLVHPNNGFVMQGKMANALGEIPEGTPVGNITLPLGTKIPAKATTKVGFSGNLDASGKALGTILNTDRVYAIEDGTSDINNLLRRDVNNDDYSTITGMAPNSTKVTLTVDDGTNVNDYAFTYSEDDYEAGDMQFNTLQGLVDEINNLGVFAAGAVDVNASGQITLGAGTDTVTFTSTNGDLSRALSAMNGTGNVTSDEFSHVASNDDNLVDLRNKQGQSLSIANGDTITINGTVGGTAITPDTLSVAAGTTYGDMANSIEVAFGINNDSGVEIDADNGALVMNGDGGSINALSEVDITSSGAGATNFDSIFSGDVGNYYEYQAAKDYTQNASISVYDSKGEPHVVTFTFTKNPVEVNKWSWQAEVGTDGASILSGDTGVVTFDSEGNLDTFSYDGGFEALRFTPGNGAGIMDVNLNPGDFGTINGLSQFAGSANAIADSQDGYRSGELTDLTIDDNGLITGFFNNGVSKNLAKIMLATFNNPNGLSRSGDNMYEVSGNSGQPVIGEAGKTVQSKIASGALEQSNVELAQEFTKMIVAQRGFQANARVLTVSDQLLQEVVALKR